MQHAPHKHTPLITEPSDRQTKLDVQGVETGQQQEECDGYRSAGGSSGVDFPAIKRLSGPIDIVIARLTWEHLHL